MKMRPTTVRSDLAGTLVSTFGRQTFSQRIASLREKHGLRREHFTTPEGLSYHAIQSLEAGRTEPKLRTVSMLAAASGIPVEDFVVDVVFP